MKPHTLIAVGTGIHVGHLTAEAREWLQSAEKVLYCVSDAATERLILELNSSAESLYRFYGEGKRRTETYEQMIARTLEAVRLHETVVVAYYGHPGFFVYPSHQAVKLAREEGHEAFMAPAVSSFDCLIADLGINIAGGCQIFEATDLMMRQRRIDVAGHVVVLQVSSLGDVAYSRNGFDRRHVPSLGEYLLKIYPSDFMVKTYHAAQFSIAKPMIEEISVKQLATEKIKSISTLYIPPMKTLPIYMKILKQYNLESLLDGKRLVPLNEELDSELSNEKL